MISPQAWQRGFELRGVVKPLTVFGRSMYCLLFAICCSRQATRKREAGQRGGRKRGRQRGRKIITQERETIVSLAHDRWRRTRTFGLTKNYLLSCYNRFGG
jgi:hypothetical protein